MQLIKVCLLCKEGEQGIHVLVLYSADEMWNYTTYF